MLIIGGDNYFEKTFSLFSLFSSFRSIIMHNLSFCSINSALLAEDFLYTLKFSMYFISFVSISAHEDRRHRCHLCGKGFIYPHKLQEHLNTHTGDKPFKCKFCNAAFASSSNKRMHERAHLGIKVKQSKKQQQ